jgi:hypothetical protein
MTVACHLMNRGWDVAFHDLEEGEGYDYLARNGTDEIEVECKRASADTGRKVHRNDFGKLAGPLLPVLEAFAIRRDGDIVHLRVADRLPAGDQDLSLLRGAVLGAMKTATGFAAIDFTVDVMRAGLSHPLIVGEDTVRQGVERYLGTEHFHSVYAVNDAASAVFAVTIQKRDRVLAYIFKQLKYAAGQFSGRRPAVIWTYIEGIEPQDWSGLVGDSALRRMSHRYMLGERRQHVFSMAYSSTGQLVSSGSGHFQYTGPLMHYDRLGPEYERLAEMLYG